MQHKAFPVLLINSILVLGKSVTHVKKMNTHGIFLGQGNTILYNSPPQILEPIFSFTSCLEEISHKVKNATGTERESAEGEVSQRRKGPHQGVRLFFLMNQALFRREV